MKHRTCTYPASMGVCSYIMVREGSIRSVESYEVYLIVTFVFVFVASFAPNHWAYHHSVVTPTGNVYVAIRPRNPIVAWTADGLKLPLFWSFQFRTTRL